MPTSAAAISSTASHAFLRATCSADVSNTDPDLLDGRQALIDGLGSLWANPATSFKVSVCADPASCRNADKYTQVKEVHHTEEGSLVLAEAIFAGGPKMVVWDLFRRVGSCIYEHWDVMMERKNQTISKHPYF